MISFEISFRKSVEDTALVKKHKGVMKNMKPVISKNGQNMSATKKVIKT